MDKSVTPSSALNRAKANRGLKRKDCDPTSMAIESWPSIVSHTGSASTIKIPAVSSRLLGKAGSIDAE